MDKTLQDANTGGVQCSADYKAELDKAAKSREDDRASSRQSDSVVAKLVDQGKHLLGVDKGETDKGGADGSAETRHSSSEHIADEHVQEFIQDAHRSHKITPKTDGT